MRPTGARAFHNVSIVVLMTASVAYFCMASDLGAVPIAVEFVRQKSVLYTGDAATVYRSIWYVRYVDWAITTPALLRTSSRFVGIADNLSHAPALHRPARLGHHHVRLSSSWPF